MWNSTKKVYVCVCVFVEISHDKVLMTHFVIKQQIVCSMKGHAVYDIILILIFNSRTLRVDQPTVH